MFRQRFLVPRYYLACWTWKGSPDSLVVRDDDIKSITRPPPIVPLHLRPSPTRSGKSCATRSTPARSSPRPSPAATPPKITATSFPRRCSSIRSVIARSQRMTSRSQLRSTGDPRRAHPRAREHRTPIIQVRSLGYAGEESVGSCRSTYPRGYGWLSHATNRPGQPVTAACRVLRQDTRCISNSYGLTYALTHLFVLICTRLHSSRLVRNPCPD